MSRQTVIIDPGNSLCHTQHQAITRTNINLFRIELLWTNFRENANWNIDFDVDMTILYWLFHISFTTMCLYYEYVATLDMESDKSDIICIIVGVIPLNIDSTWSSGGLVVNYSNSLISIPIHTRSHWVKRAMVITS